ncbi:D-alanyl-D-alanine carboxypeptidase/D-alanyl-D-alanine-endopeptidase [Limnohabitans sp.]|uniref:D-alanyl-D-alanine carboxypeptidase/D-alanyl-D-alanine endopeptidase n=1 Tax=Limnohabitans sp. TaxID=1907725 RepID=UPI0038621688
MRSEPPKHTTEDVGQLPPEVQAALQRAKVPSEHFHVMVVDAQANNAPRLSHQAQVRVNPASLMKLATTIAALDTLGPAFVWRTPVYVDGPVRDGVLQGNVYIKGSGDPRLGAERLWLLMRRIQGLGIQKIQGDIMLDRSAFDVPPRDAASFDGEPLRPYNAAPDALLLNFKSLLIQFVPDRAANVARVQIEPPLAGVQFPATVPLSNSDCSDYRSALRADWSDHTRIRFAGSFPAVCGEKMWPIAYAAPQQFAQRAIAGMWQHVGGQLSGQVREGAVPANLQPSFYIESASLAETIRDINKYSNNVMAQHVFLTLSQQQRGVGSLDSSRELMQRWWRERVGGDVPTFDNGSGLSRDERISAQALARLLQVAWASPTMSELMSSLPVTGLDGTMKRSKAQASAHLKTGSLRDVAGVAGFVDTASGKRWVVVAVLHHANANAARPALDAVIDWVAQQP